MMRFVGSLPSPVATRLVVSLSASSTSELARRAREGAGRADILELRVDAVDRPDLEAVREVGRELGRPLLLTCRSASEGGAFRGTEEERLAILGRAIELGFEYVDFEIQALEAAPPKRPGTRLVLSHHDFDTFPDGLDRSIARA